MYVLISLTADIQLLLNAAVATRFPGADKVAGIWEFTERELPVLSWLTCRFSARDIAGSVSSR